MTLIRLIIITIFFVLSSNANAYDIKQGDMYFNIIAKNECEVAKGCDKESVEIPRTVYYYNQKYNVTRIGAGAFYDCSSISNITIPKTVTSIEDYAFYGCMTLESINIPESVESIGKGTFSYCVSLEIINIPEGVKDIGKEAFAYCCGLKSITIPESVKSIGQGAFDDCTSLKSIKLPNNGIAIEGMAFPWCTSLKNVSIPDGTKSIGDATFFGCSSLEQITLPFSVNRIGYSAFSECQNVKQIVSFAVQPPSLGNEQYCVFSDKLYLTTKVFVPTSSLEAYRQAREWKKFKNLQGGAENMTAIESITLDENADGKTKIYDIQGNRLKNKSRGINIISSPDGTTRKTVVK